jgi:hypothetical protein
MGFIEAGDEAYLVDLIKASKAYSRFSEKFLNAKAEAEDKAWKLLVESRGDLSNEVLQRFFDTVDLSADNTPWFGDLLGTPNRNLILESPIEKRNEWFEHLLFSGGDYGERVAICLTTLKIKGISKGLTTLILYLSDPENYSIWLPIIERGLNLLGRTREMTKENVGEAYRSFNSSVIDFRATYQFLPQELDWVLSLIARAVTREGDQLLISEEVLDGLKHKLDPDEDLGIRSWSRTPGVDDLIGRKTVDWSIFEYGTHIPLKFIPYFDKANGGVHLSPGENHNLNLMIDAETFKATLFNIKRKGLDTDTLQIRYDTNEEFKRFLQNKFRRSYDYLVRERPKGSKKTHILVPKELAESIEFYQTERPFEYTLKAVVSDTQELKEQFTYIMDNYLAAKTNNAIRSKVKNSFIELQSTLQASPIVSKYINLKVAYGMGFGSIAKIPWLTLLDGRITKSTQQGVYCAYLFRADMSGVYITFNQGVGKTGTGGPTKEEISKIHEKAVELRKFCGSLELKGFKLDDDIDLADTSLTGNAYEKSTTVYKFYDLSAFPSDVEINTDLADILSVYEDYVSRVLSPTKPFWLFQANPKYYDLSGAVAELKEILWTVNQYSKEIQKGDRVFLWEAGKDAGIVGTGTILSDPAKMEANAVEDKFTRDAERLSGAALRVRVSIDQIPEKRIKRENLATHILLKDLDVIKFANATNFKVKTEMAEELLRLFGEPPEGGPVRTPNKEYSLSDFSQDVGLNEELLGRWAKAIERKGQAIFYGPPGTGKTYVAERMAKHLIGGGFGFYELVQFHPAYSYEDFMEGIRPQTRDKVLEYPMVSGRFLAFCQRAQNRKDTCVLIVDEINRANLSRVLGELMYLLEYRDKEIELAGGKKFGIPHNVRILGTMNTADRSIALVDHALRRRFAFLELYPKYEVLERYHEKTGFPVQGLTDVIKSLNKQINDRHYEVGLTFFLREDLAEQIEDIWQMEIEPYLEEYFFDQQEKVNQFRWEKVKDTILP